MDLGDIMGNQGKFTKVQAYLYISIVVSYLQMKHTL